MTCEGLLSLLITDFIYHLLVYDEEADICDWFVLTPLGYRLQSSHT